MSIVLGYIKAKIQGYSSYKPPFPVFDSGFQSVNSVLHTLDSRFPVNGILTVSGILDSMS